MACGDGAEVAGDAVADPSLDTADSVAGWLASPVAATVGSDVAVTPPRVASGELVGAVSSPPQPAKSRPIRANEAAKKARGRPFRLKQVAASNCQPVEDDVGARDDHERRGDGLDVRQGPAHDAHHGALEYGHA